MASDKNTPPERDEFDVDVVPGQRRGAHRTQSPPAVVAILAALAALLVVALIVTVIGMTGLGTPDPDEVAASASTSEPPAQTAEPIQPAIDQGASITVLNGTRLRNISTRVKLELENDGWIVNRTGNNEDRSLTSSVVQYSDPELAQTAQALVDALGGGVIQQVSKDDLRENEDLRVIIGQTYAVAKDLIESTTTSPTSGRSRSSSGSDDEEESTSSRSGTSTRSGSGTSTSTRNSRTSD